jgi:hypothetical protein
MLKYFSKKIPVSSCSVDVERHNINIEDKASVSAIKTGIVDVIRKNNISLCLLLLSLFSLPHDQAFAGGARSLGGDKEQPRKIYKERARQMLNSIISKEKLSDIDLLTEEEKRELRDSLRNKDSFLYAKPPELKSVNKKINISLNSDDVVVVKLGHSFVTTLTVSDKFGNSWSFDTLSNISNEHVVALQKPAPNILTLKPSKMAGTVNVPILLKGQNKPIVLMFEITSDESYFLVDLVVDGIGDSKKSQDVKSLDELMKHKIPEPKLSNTTDEAMMLRGLTPLQGYSKKTIYDEYGDRVDDDDYIAWEGKGKIYLLTKYEHYTPNPIGVSVGRDGVTKLLEYNKTNVLLVKKNNKIIMLYLK